MKASSYIREKTRHMLQYVRNSRRLAALAWSKYPGLVASLYVFALLTAALPFARTGAVALLVNELATAGPGAGAFALIGVLVLASAVPSIAYTIFSYLDKKFWINITQEFDVLYVRKRGDIDVATHEDPKFNDVERRANENMYRVVNLLSSQPQFIQDSVTLITASAVLLFFDPGIFFVMLVGSLPAFLVEARYGRDVWGIYDSRGEERRRYYDIRDKFYSKTDLVELKLFQNVGKFNDLITGLLRDFNESQKAVERGKFLAQLGATLVSIGATGVSIYWAVGQALGGGIEVGTLVFMLTTLGSFEGAFTSFLFRVARQFQESLFATDVFAVLDTKPVIERPKSPKPIGEGVPEISFEDVSFKYPGTDAYVLKDFSLTIRPGEKLAVVGVNGAGKTTFVKLLCRFYDVTEGRILVGGKDIREIDLDEWYSMLAVLFQDYSTYHFLAKDGIALGRSSVELDLDRVVRSAEASDASPFIEKWERKYDQMIGKEFTGGVELSRGQQQKLALARSFYRDPMVLILDEPTASVDAEAEAKIFERLESMDREATMIFISHRFSTVRKADTICVIEGGRIAELGTHAELVANGKTYARLFELQAKGYRE